MKLTILTTITRPNERQDKWIEALSCYHELADEVIVVNGSGLMPIQIKARFPKVKEVSLFWEHDWNWIELPRHLNAGLDEATGDWVLKLDIDQLIHEDDFSALRELLADIPKECHSATMQKMSLTYAKKYYEKGSQEVLFRRLKGIRFGKNIQRKTDLCFPVDTNGIKGFETVDGYVLPLGKSLKSYRTRFHYWNYDYFFKTEEFTKKEFWRMAQAYQRYFGEYAFGDSEEASFQCFLNMVHSRYLKSPYTAELETHPKFIQDAVKTLTSKQLGFNCWGKYEQNS